MPTSPSKVVAILAVLLGVWALVFWMYRPGEVNLAGTPITMGRAPRFEDLKGPALAAIEPLETTPTDPMLVPAGNGNTTTTNQGGGTSLPPSLVIGNQGELSVAPKAPAPGKSRTVVIPPKFREYTVAKGDVSFEVIAQRVYGDRRFASAISRANPFVTPNKLFVGRTVLRIPEDPTNTQGKVVEISAGNAGSKANQTGKKNEPAATTAGGKTYVTKSGDTLSSISKQFYGKASMWKKIADANRAVLPDPAKVKPGIELTIPE
jgi:nucleoid-associated protein YgaU